MKTKLTRTQSTALTALVFISYVFLVVGGCTILVRAYS